jgi:hypothetical protein
MTLLFFIVPTYTGWILLLYDKHLYYALLFPFTISTRYPHKKVLKIVLNPSKGASNNFSYILAVMSIYVQPRFINDR